MLAGDRIVARTDFALFSVDTATFEVVRHTKGSGLSEVNPTALAYDEGRQQWIVGYANGSIDFRDSWGTQNLPDFRISQVTGDKAINAITIEGDRAYLRDQRRGVVVDLIRREIADTWPLAAGGEAPWLPMFVLDHEDQWLVGTNAESLTAPQSKLFCPMRTAGEPLEAFPELGAVLELKRHANQWWLATGTKGGSECGRLARQRRRVLGSHAWLESRWTDLRRHGLRKLDPEQRWHPVRGIACRVLLSDLGLGRSRFSCSHHAGRTRLRPNRRRCDRPLNERRQGLAWQSRWRDHHLGAQPRRVEHWHPH